MYKSRALDRKPLKLLEHRESKATPTIEIVSEQGGNEQTNQKHNPKY